MTRVSEGSTIHLDRQMVLVCVRRPARMAPVSDLPASEWPGFGEADRFGFVGESPAAWRLRDTLAFVARREGHVLVTGESGAGKELAARMLHGLSARAQRPWVARNAATFPEGLVDAELFGNVRDYPNPGMRERPGMVGEAHGTTLFLDEIGELPHTLQAHLLRVLDAGEYRRLGEDRVRSADLRFIAATNRDASALKHDLGARLTFRVAVPGLNARPEDIPLLAYHLLATWAGRDADVAKRFCDEARGRPLARIAPELIVALLRHHYTHHARELASLLWQAMATSHGHSIELGNTLRESLAPTSPTVAAAGLAPEVIQACLDRHDGNQNRAYRELGLKNRDVLFRLIKKHGLVVRQR